MRFSVLSFFLCVALVAAREQTLPEMGTPPVAAGKPGNSTRDFTEYRLDKVPVGSRVSIRLRDDSVIADVKIIQITDGQIHYFSTHSYYGLADDPKAHAIKGQIARRKVFRIATPEVTYSDFPIRQGEHDVYKTYYEYIISRGDFVKTADGATYYGMVEAERPGEILLSMTDGTRTFYRAEVRACRINGQPCEPMVNDTIPSAKGAKKFTEALEAALPADAKAKSFGVSQFQNASGNKTADNMAASLRSKAVAHLTSLGYRVADRDTLPTVLKEKQLAQQGVLSGKDQSLDQSVQNDYIISGNLEGSGSGNTYQVVINVVSTRSLAVVASKIAQVEATDGATDPDAFRHNGFHAQFMLGPGYASYNTTGVGSFDSLALGGTSFMVNLKAGFALEENLILGLSLGSSFASEPNITSSPDILTEKRLTGRTLGLSTWGPSFTYYTRQNYYASLMAGAATAIYTDTRQETSVKNGFATGLTFGREWWQSENFAMGISLNIMYSSIALTDLELLLKTTAGDIKDADFRMSQIGVYLAFTVAYK